MLLKHVYLYLESGKYPPELTKSFGFRTRYMCNFVERKLKPVRFDADGFNKICVRGSLAPQEACPIIPENAVAPEALFDPGTYQHLPPGGHHAFFEEMLREGLEKCARHHAIPMALFDETLRELRESGYVNSWVHQTKHLRPRKLTAQLVCTLDDDRFRLVLELKNDVKLLWNGQILETLPDEIIFAHRFKEVAFEEDSIVVKDKFGDSLFRLPLSAVGAN
jgi:hypothetical protein